MLRIRTVWGEELGILDLARFLGSLNGDTHPVRALKRHLQSMCGLSRFRQRLLFPGDDVCQDDDHTLRPGEVQVVLLNFCPASDVEAEALRDAARSGLTSVVETVLQRPQDPDLSDPAPLFEASKHGHLEVVCLLMEAKADKDKSTHRGCGILQLGMGSWRLHFAGVQCGHRQSQTGRLHLSVHRSSERAVGGCTPFAGLHCGHGQGNE